MRYFLHIAYDGGSFRGWQYQPCVPSVQEAIELKLEKIFKTKIPVFGCGRTDAGVHASQYVLHIDVEKALTFDLKFILNQNLPRSIIVHEVIDVDESLHARYSATSRTYDYFIHTYPDAILSEYSSFYPYEDLDISAMQAAAAMLTEYKDYKAICKQPLLYKHTLCEVTYSAIYVDADAKRLRFTITANRFLRGMIRLCVFFFLKIGNREMTVDEFEQLLILGTDVDKIPSKPNGLFLTKITYDAVEFKYQTDMVSLLKTGLEG